LSAKRVKLEIVTPERTVLKTEAASILIPGVDGYIGIQYNHAPMVAGMTYGILHYGEIRAEKERAAVSGGFVEVSDNRVTVLADTAELADEIDVARSKAALERARRRLKSRQENIDYARAEAALSRAMNRLRAAGAL